jgi:peptide/nickel transport system ATP-binding protein/oligopeptide transport system ATP-binding protein
MIEPVLRIEHLVTTYPIRSGLFRRTVGHVHALNDVSLDLLPNETLGVVGESGCGKTTLGRSILRLVEANSGSVMYRGRDVLAADSGEMRRLRKEMQIVFQDPYASLNPRMPINEIVGEPLAVHGVARGERREKVAAILQEVGLLPEHGNRYPHEFSGGQRQRIGIARALILDPSVLILDEPVSALDVSIQAQILNLLRRIQREKRISMIFIAHDLSVVRHVSDRVAVMYLGRVVEVGERQSLYEHPKHPYTASLLSAVPVADPKTERSRQRIVLQGDVPSPANPPSGCEFRTRCPIAEQRCVEERPQAQIVDGVQVACHFPLGRGESLPDRIARR